MAKKIIISEEQKIRRQVIEELKRKGFLKESKYVPRNEEDDYNPKYIFSLTGNELLGAIVKGQINAVALAKKELQNRGYNADNEWVGFGSNKKQ